MILVAGGDSFVWGSELADSSHGGNGGHSLRTFPSLLAKDHEYQCVAYPGNANDSIARMTMIACEQNKNKKQIALVCWTFPNRYEFRFNIKDTQQWEVINTWSIGKQFNDRACWAAHCSLCRQQEGLKPHRQEGFAPLQQRAEHKRNEESEQNLRKSSNSN
jgi:hypothetical protein